MDGKISYSREEVEEAMMVDHLSRFPTPEGYKWTIGIGGYGKEVEVELVRIKKEEE